VHVCDIFTVIKLANSNLNAGVYRFPD